MGDGTDNSPEKIKWKLMTGRYDHVIRNFKSHGYAVGSLEDAAKIYLQSDNLFSLSCSTSDGILCIPGSGGQKTFYLTKHSFLTSFPEVVTRDYLAGKNFHLLDGEVEAALANSVKIDIEKIPFESFGDNPLTSFAFGSAAKTLGSWLKLGCDIDTIPIVNAYGTLKDDLETPYLRPAYFFLRLTEDRAMCFGETPGGMQGITLLGVEESSASKGKRRHHETQDTPITVISGSNRSKYKTSSQLPIDESEIKQSNIEKKSFEPPRDLNPLTLPELIAELEKNILMPKKRVGFAPESD